MPCHSPADYAGKHADPRSAPQCAGAAIFRANIRVAGFLPGFLHRLPAESEGEVFTSISEFYQHHEGLSEEDANRKAAIPAVMELLEFEMSKTPMFRIPVTKGGRDGSLG